MTRAVLAGIASTATLCPVNTIKPERKEKKKKIINSHKKSGPRPCPEPRVAAAYRIKRKERYLLMRLPVLIKLPM